MDKYDSHAGGRERNYVLVAGYIFILFFLFIASYGQQDCRALIQSAEYAAGRQDFVTSMELLTKARAQIGGRHDSGEYYQILNLMGNNQLNLHNYEEALAHFLEAYAIASVKPERPDEVEVMNNIARVHLSACNYKEANSYYKRIYEYAGKTGDSLSVGIAAENIALTAQYTGEINEAEKFLHIASQYLINHEDKMLQLKLLEIKNLRLKKKTEEAGRCAIGLLPRLQTPEYRNLKVSALRELAEIYFDKSEWDSAVGYAGRALLHTTEPEARISLYAFLSEAYKKCGHYEKAISCKDSFIVATDSLNEVRDRTFLENSRIRLELLKNEKELSVSQARLKIMVIVFILSGLTVIILIWAFVNKAARNKQHKKIVELQLQREKSDKLLLENKLKKQEALALLEQERLRHTRSKLEYDIEIKNKELTSRALFLANRNKLIGELVNSISGSRDLSANSGLKNDLERLKTQLEGNDDWNSFIVHFEQTNQHFITMLRERHPGLTSNEIRFISLIYINLNTKEISSLLNITPEYCKKKKQQISRKLGLSSATQLYNYLFELRKDSFGCEKNELRESANYRAVM